MSFFVMHAVRQLELTIKGNVLYFATACCCSKHAGAPQWFIVQLKLTTANIVCQFLALLSGCNLGGIAYLSIQTCFDHGDGPERFTKTNIQLERLFALLSSVTLLQTSIYFLLEFLTRQPNTPIILPNLAHVQLATSAAGYRMEKHFDGWVSHDNPREYRSALCSFVAHRRDIGVPLSTLDKSRFWINLADQELPASVNTLQLVAAKRQYGLMSRLD